MMTDGNAQTVKDLYLAGLITKDEARSELGFIDKPFCGEELTAILNSARPKPKPTRGEEIAEQNVFRDGERLQLGNAFANAASMILPPYAIESHAIAALSHIRRCIAGLIDKAIAEEREACAEVADGFVMNNLDGLPSPYTAYLVNVSGAIRQRGVA